MNQNCIDNLAFSAKEKIVAAIPFNISILIGAYGLYRTSWVLTAIYLTFCYLGVIIMMRYTICPRCPHLLEGNDCLNMPAPLVKKLIAKNRTGPLNTIEKTLQRTVKYGILIIPVYWLIPYLYLLIPFVAFYLIGQATFSFYFCRHCKNEVCIQNRNAGCIHKAQTG
jgi:hypothetical protein